MRERFLLEQSKMYNLFGGLQVSHFIFLLVLGWLSAIMAYTAELAIFEIYACKYL
jgi:hypothetical protein